MLSSSPSDIHLGRTNRVLATATGGACKLFKSASGWLLTCVGAGGPGRDPRTIADGGTTRVEFVGPNPNRPPCGDELERPLRKMREFRPDVAVVNIGPGLLHFQGLGVSVEGCVAEAWMGYEGWLEGIVRAAEESGTGVLVFKTTDSACSDSYVGEFARAARLYLRRDRGALRGCFDDLRGKVSGTVDDDEIRDYCANGRFDDLGSVYLNRRLVEFVDARRRDPATSVRIAILNDHDMQSCGSTRMGDGRHNHILNLARIRLLGNLLTCDSVAK